MSLKDSSWWNPRSKDANTGNDLGKTGQLVWGVQIYIAFSGNFGSKYVNLPRHFGSKYVDLPKKSRGIVLSIFIKRENTVI